MWQEHQWHTWLLPCVPPFLFLPHIDVTCDLLLNRCMAKWNLWMWIKALDLEDELLLTGFQNLEFIKCVSCLLQLKFLIGSWITPTLHLTNFRTWKHCKACKRALSSSGNSTELPCCGLWYQQLLINLSQNVILAYPIFLEHTQGNFTSLGWCGQCMHACRVGSLFLHVILGSTWGTSGTLLLHFAT